MKNNGSLKVLILTTSFPRFTGDEASVFVQKLTTALSDEGTKGIIIVPQDNKEPLRETQGNFTICRFKYGLLNKGALAFGDGIMPNLRKKWWLIFQAPLLIFGFVIVGFNERKNWQVIQANWLATGIPALFLSLLLGRPYILTIRGEDIKLLRSKINFLFLPVLRQAKKITTVSDEFKRELDNILDSNRYQVSVIPNGITRINAAEQQKKDLLNKLGIDLKLPLLTYVGRIIPLKQPEVLIKLLSQITDFQLVLAGRINEEYKSKLIALATEINVQDRLLILGPLTPESAVILISLSRFYVSASQHEGRSNSLLEALAAGVPPVVSDIAGHRELVKDNENGLLFSTNNLNTCTVNILKVHSNQHKYHQYSHAAQISVSHLTWGKSAKAYNNLFTNSQPTSVT
jgi:glycosyltransferase involved in cell wall biosynthesis